MAAAPELDMNGEVAAPMNPKISMASAMMKLPMNSRMVESNTLPNTSRRWPR
jgi:hypothetical protein